MCLSQPSEKIDEVKKNNERKKKKALTEKGRCFKMVGCLGKTSSLLGFLVLDVMVDMGCGGELKDSDRQTD